MNSNYKNEPLLDMYVFETEQLLEQLEQLLLSCEEANGFSKEAIDEIFRIMHTIKGSSAMMMFNGISKLAHCVEDLFYYLRNGQLNSTNSSEIADLVFEAIDFIKEGIQKIKNGNSVEDDPKGLIESISRCVNQLKGEGPADSVQGISDEDSISSDTYLSGTQAHAYKAVLYFDEGSEMENIRAYSVVHGLKDIASQISHWPEELFNDDGCEEIKQNGFSLIFKSNLDYGKIQEFLLQTLFLKKMELTEMDNEAFNQISNSFNPIEATPVEMPAAAVNSVEEEKTAIQPKKETQLSSSYQSILSVDVLKLDRLMDLVGEMVIAEAMVIQNPDLIGLELNNFQKAAQHLDKITKEIQDMVMSIRMVSLTATFQKMNRVVRDMCKNLKKEAKLIIIGEETEVDKNIIERISDPLMHLVRNALDHGIEPAEEREAKGKPKAGTITLEAQSAGSDVLILIRDDGRGLDRDKILKKAREKGLLYKAESDMTDREVFNLILLPGFSTKDKITEYSGRGVGMDVVAKNIESIGGSVVVESTLSAGTAITLRIPLTLAIVDGMNIRVGDSIFTLPTISIRESFRPGVNDTFTDPEGNEMIMVRGSCYPILRLHLQHKN